MKFALLPFLFVFAALFLHGSVSRTYGAQSKPPSHFYVAPNGSDAWAGTLTNPNANKTNGPFATIGRAQQAARAVSKSGTPVRVSVRGGRYALNAPLSFDESDSGASPNAPVVYEAFANETPILSGGTRITGWEQTKPGCWEVTLPADQRGDWRFSQLYVNGERRTRPRLPKQGYYTIGGSVPSTPDALGKGYNRFRYRAGDINPNWQNRSDIEVLCLHIWSMSRFNIADLDAQDRVLTLSGYTRKEALNYSLVHGNRYLIENVKEALSDAGQWYLARKTGILTYLAHPGENPNRDVVVAPRHEQLLAMNGTKNLTFRGFTFADAAWNLTPEGVRTGQAEIGIPAALRLTNAQNVSLENCTVRNVGGYGVSFGQGTQHCKLDGCVLRDLGAGGVLIGEAGNPKTDEEQVTHNTVRDCLIVAGGRVHSSAVGVWIGQASHNTVEHNEIADFYYSGISAGWTWGYAKNECLDNTFAYNHIHHLGQGVLSDMGGIYTIGTCPGTKIHHNRIHDVHAYDYGGWGIYFDEGSTGVTASDNVVYNTTASGFMQHYGTNNIVENNIFARGGEAQIIRSRADNNKSTHPPGEPDMHAASSFTIRRNIIYSRDVPFYGGNWTGSNFTLANNLYWDTQPKTQTLFPGDTTLAAWQQKGSDAGSILANPLFAAPEKGDFALRPGSPAAKIGFAPIDVSKAGRLTGKAQATLARRTYPVPPPRDYVADDFEDSTVGERPSSLLVIVSEEGKTPVGTVRVTNEKSANGKQSLKITDAPGQAQTWNPNFSYKLKLTKGVAVGRFALYLEAGAVVTHEWRDAEIPFHRGPSLKIAADGTLAASGANLGKLPFGQWLRFTVSCPLGSKANGKYDVVVEPLHSGMTPRRYANLSCDPAFQSLRNWGFVSETNDASVFYLDDLSLIVQ